MRNLLLGLLVFAGCAAPAAVEKPPPEWSAALKRADDALDALKTRLMTRLVEEVNRSGPAGAIPVCGNEAKGAADDAAKRFGVEIGRTSARLRNPANAPRAWVKP